MDNHRASRILLASLFAMFALGLTLMLAPLNEAYKGGRDLESLPFVRAPAAYAVCPFTVTVTNTNDNGVGSLRQAIVDVCSGGTVDFGVAGTITLTSGDLFITQSLTVAGPGSASLKVSGNHTHTVFFINPGVTVTISGVTIADGVLGIFNYAKLNVISSTISGNSGIGGAGLNNQGGAVNIFNSTFFSNTTDGNGGGIMNILSGTMTISNSTFTRNSGNQGGAINNQGGGLLNIINSTFYSNTAFTNGPPAHGGAIENWGTTTITNSTFSNNSSEVTGGGALDNVGGPGVTITVKNTIVANSVTGRNCSGTITDGGNNLQFGGTIANSCGGAITIADPKLSPLGNYGGPTQTLGLFVGSAAIDGVPSGCPPPSTDQRGFTRPQGAHCDIGAFEGTLYPLYLPLIEK